MHLGEHFYRTCMVPLLQSAHKEDVEVKSTHENIVFE